MNTKMLMYTLQCSAKIFCIMHLFNIIMEDNSEVTKYSLLMHCIKIKSPAKFLLNEQYVFVGGNISFLCVLSCSSEEA